MNKEFLSLPILMIPALNCDGRLFQHQITTLENKGYRVIVIDNTKASSNEELVRSLLKTAPPRFHLMGLSMGGYAAFEIIKQAPERVEKFILLDTTVRPDSEEKKQKRFARLEKVAKGELEIVTAELWRTMVAKDRVEDKNLFKIYQEMSQKVGKEGFTNQMNQVLSRDDFRNLLPHIKAPTLVIVGEDDQRSPMEVSQEIVDGINKGEGTAGARLKIIKNAGHFSSLEQPEKVSQLILDFLKEG